ncbi:MAG: nucleotidyltransferase [Bacteroidales bacterium]|nr:nucleotidyltransferase [Bacteroidales bacterium]
MQPTLLILAAGMGSRYGGLKQLDGIGPSGETIMDYSIYDAKRAGFGKVVFVIRKSLENDFKEKIFSKYEGFIEIDYVFQELDNLPEGCSVPEGREKPWGTAHAVMVAEEKINEPFAVINADDFYGADSFTVMASFLQALDAENNYTYCLLAYKLKNTLSEHGSVSRGICELDKNKFLERVVEHTKIYKENGKILSNFNHEIVELREDAPTSMNLMGFTPSAFEYLKQYFRAFFDENNENLKAEFYLPVFLTNVIKSGQGKVKVLPSNERWFGVTYQEDRPIVVQSINEKVANGEYPKKLF